MLKMAGALPICRYHCPTILQRLYFPASHIEHGFNRQDHTRTQYWPFTRPTKIGDQRIFVQIFTNTMPVKFSNNRKTIGFSDLLNRRRNITQVISRASLPDTSLESLPGCVHQPGIFFFNLTYRKGSGRVAAKSINLTAHINTNNVPLPENLISRNPMHDFFIDRDTGRMLIAAITDKHRQRIFFPNQLLGKTIKVLGCNSHSNLLTYAIQNPANNGTGPLYPFNLVSRLNLYLRHVYLI